MVPGIRRPLIWLAAAMAVADAAAQAPAPAAAPGARPTEPAEPAAAAAPAGQDGAPRSALRRSQGLLMLDYQVIDVPQEPSIDLLGFHVLKAFGDGLYAGVGGYAPHVKGEYGGFMAFDVTLHAQRRLWGTVFADAGVSLGGGGGGRSKEQSKVLSGTGGFVKGYVGLGVDLEGFAVGARVATMTFKDSAIDSTHLNVFLHVPFSYTAGRYASAGGALAAADAQGARDDPAENTLTWGLHAFKQIDPVGTNKNTIQVADLQYAHYLTRDTYWYASLGVGYHGIPLYNQVIGGLGHRLRVAPRLAVHGQLGIGSGGYAPETIDTGAGLLVHPKLSAEFALTRKLGLALSAGYLVAPKGTSKNATLGMALSYHLHPDGQGPGAADPVALQGYRFHLFQQTALNVRSGGADRTDIQMLTGQLDTLVSEHVYVPLQAAVAYNAYIDYPGYGELLTGIGWQSRHRDGDRWRFFGQLLGGANVHGGIVKASVGLNWRLSDELAVHAMAGTARALTARDVNFRAEYVGLGMTYRFSVPSW
jgi:hypothetical protein